MSDALAFVLFAAAWVVLQTWVLPRLVRAAARLQLLEETGSS